MNKCKSDPTKDCPRQHNVTISGNGVLEVEITPSSLKCCQVERLGEIINKMVKKGRERNKTLT